MSYTVKPLSQSDPSYHVDEVKFYPVQSGETDRFVHSSSLFLQSKASSFRTKYRVVVAQEVDGKEDNLFKLWNGHDRSKAKEAFDTIQATLTPLLDKGTIRFTKPLLKEVILPAPIRPSEIVTHLIDVMEQQPDSHLGWLAVIQALLDDKLDPLPMDPESRRRYIESLKGKYALHNKSNHVIAGVMQTLPLLAVPNAIEYVEDVEDDVEDEKQSNQIWNFFKKGILAPQKIGTWLIDAIRNDHPRCCINLILSRAMSTNEQYSSTLQTALHFAVQKSDLTLVKLLLAYQADPTIPNAAGETPVDIAHALKSKNADKILFALEEMKMLQKTARSYFTQNTALLEKRDNSDIFLLSLDGGGMKSIVQCQILAAINQRMSELDNTCEPLQSHFDYIAGTSAGAIIAAILLYKSTVTVSQTGLYLYKFMNNVFGSDKMERSEKLKEFITDAVGESTVMSDLPKGNIVVTATIANIRPSKLHLMTNYGEERDGLKGPNERKVWEALIASSAAPTYFPAFECFLDGGLMANNPTLAAMTDIFEQEGKSAKIGFVLSLGTGFLDPPTEVDNFEVYVPGFTFGIISTLVNSSLGLMSLLNHFVEQSTQSDGEVVRQARSWCNSIGANYQRLSPPLMNDIAPDMNSLEELVDILYDSEKYVLEEYRRIDEIAKIILSK